MLTPRLIVALLIWIVVASSIVFAAPPPPAPDDLLRDNGTWIWNVTEMISWYTGEWWGPAAYIVLFLVPASIYIAKRSVTATVVVLVIEFGVVAVVDSMLRYIAVLVIALGLSYLVYRVVWKPEKI